MAFPRSRIFRQQTYRTEGGKLVYVQEVEGQKVTWNYVGDTERRETSLGRFVARIECETTNG